VKHYLMKRVVTDPDTGVVIGYQGQKTFPPEQARYMLKKNPGAWEVVDPEYEVPDDWRPVKGQRAVMRPTETIADLKKAKPSASFK
jgi:hypothetical protein